MFIRGMIESAKDVAGRLKLFSAKGRWNEDLEDKELMQQSGFTSVPKKGDEILILRYGDLQIAVASNSNNRPEVVEGEAAMFSDAKNFIKISADGSIQIESEKMIRVKSPETTVNSDNVTVEAKTARVEAASINVISQDINLGSEGLTPFDGVLTGTMPDPITGVPWPVKSATVKASA